MPLARPVAGRLTDAEARVLLDRLPPLDDEVRDEAPFAIREASLPPPRAGRVVEAPFPPEGDAERPIPSETDPVEIRPLEILRWMPEGEVALAPHLSVTFSQPMVALDSHEGLARQAIPVRLTPQPPGEWRWTGTRTLVFQPEDRFPMATSYRVEVPAGTRAAAGAVLASDASWSFSTPAPSLVRRHPEGRAERRDTLMVAVFDQRIDAAAVLASVTVRAGRDAVATRLATAAEIEADPVVERLVRGIEPGRFVVFRTEHELPADAAVEVAVGRGTPSAEGPRTTPDVQRWAFRTYGRFEVRGHRCGWRGTCAPGDPWQIEFTNPVDPSTLTDDAVSVVPALPAMKLVASGTTLVIRGVPRGRTTYTVTLSDRIADVFGQPLQLYRSMVDFEVGPAPAGLFTRVPDFIVLDPAGGPRFAVRSVNLDALRVQAYAVGPEDWSAWRAHRREVWRKPSATPPGRRVINATIPLATEPDTVVETLLDLGKALPGGLGQVVLVVRPASSDQDLRDQVIRTWVQATRIGLDAFADGETVLAWANDLVDGRPLDDVELRLGDASARSDASGLARLTVGSAPEPLLVARRNGDVAVVPVETGWRVYDEVRFFVFDDRKLYRPGETVRVKGWLRTIGAGPRGDVGAPPASLDAVSWMLSDSRGNEVAKGSAPVGELGGFDVAVDLPDTINLGHATLRLSHRSRCQHDHVFEVQEFRRPEFEVTATASEGPLFAGDAATVSVRASYYAGGALPGADVAWTVTATPGSYRPPNRETFSFGPYLPWWRGYGTDDEPEREETFEATTDGSGVHRLRIDLDGAGPARPHVVRAEATVQDVNRQAWTAGASLLVHPAERYVGLRADRAFVGQGEPITIDVIVTDVDGLAIPGATVRLRAERLEWELVNDAWEEVPKDARTWEVASGAEPVRTGFEPAEGGTWRVVARVPDERGREGETVLQVWVAGGRIPPRRDLEQEQVTLVPDHSEYQAGDVARILVLAPFTPAEGVLTLRRSGLLREERFTMTGGSHTLEIPIEDAFVPNVHIGVDLVGQAPRDGAPAGAPTRPAFATGTLDLPVPPASRTLGLTVRPRERSLVPGGETTLDLALTDPAGRPVANAEAAIVVVDEAVLALTGYQLPDPLAVFYARRDASVSDAKLRSFVLLSRPVDLDELAALAPPEAEMAGGARLMRTEASPMMAMAAGPAMDFAPAAEPIRARTDFAALALFAGSVSTDADGLAHVPVKVPDSLTRYRIMVVAASGPRSFGAAEATLVARLPLMVRPSAPRFLNFGDRFELPVVVQNQTDAAMTVDVAVRARNAALTDGDGRRIEVAANDRAEVRFPMATGRPGKARIQVGAASGAAADAAEVGLPVWTPATTEAFATYGQVDDGAVVQPVTAPSGAVPGFGGLEITTSSTALQALTDAVLYLVDYPFECAEQLASRVLGVAALRDVLGAFGADGLPKPAEIEAAVTRDLERLRGLQNPDGGFGFWRRGEASWPYVSIHAAHALARAQAKGFPVSAETIARSKTYLRRIERSIPAEYGVPVRLTLHAYALAVRAQLDDPDPAGARALLREAGIGGLSFEALGWVLGVLARDAASAADITAIRRRLANNVAETAASAHFVDAYGDGAHLLLHSNRRADAILLEALIADSPTSDLIPKLVDGLLAHRTAGRWMNTQENVFVLLALDRYFATYEKATPDFVARAWLGERYAGAHEFRGRTTERSHLAIPMAVLGEGTGTNDLLLAKDGPGRLYYRIGLRYAPAGLQLAPLDRGFTVERTYEGVDDPGDVRRDEDGTWRIRAGARVRVRLTMVAPSRRYHVALVDPLPAGLEPLNPALAVSGTVPGDGGSDVTVAGGTGLGGPRSPGGWWWWTRPWFDHQNLRDDRVEAFSSLLWEGVHAYAYVARATTPGTFIVPPPKAEEMYAPETFGRGATDRVVVEETA